MKRVFPSFLFSLFVSFLVTGAALGQKVNYLEIPKPFKNDPVFKTPMGSVKSGILQMPFITWAADGVTIHANGGEKPNAGSKLGRAAGTPVKLERVDEFDKQLRAYISGDSPFLRGTIGMINLASEGLTAISPELTPVVFLKLSWSTGADGFVAKGVEKLSDLKGKTIVVQRTGPHMDLINVLLEDAGLTPADVTVKYVADITENPDNPVPGINDPAGAFRADSSVDGAAAIFPDILTLTAGGNVGTGAEDSVKGAKPILTTRTASRVIADVYAVRSDWFKANRDRVKSMAKTLLEEQMFFRDHLDNIAKKKSADQAKLREFKQLSRPLAGIILFDEAAVEDFVFWLGLDSELALFSGNDEFFGNERSPVGFAAANKRIQAYYVSGGLISSPTYPTAASFKWFESTSLAAPVVALKPVFSSAQAVRSAAESADAGTLFTYTFGFPASMADLAWRDYPDVFNTIHEKVTRYGGAVVQLRGHSDNFFYNFVRMKRSRGDTSYERKVGGAFKKFPLPQVEELSNAANKLSYSRAFAVKRAYAQYLREHFGLSAQEMDLSRFDVKGMGVSDPRHSNPSSPQQRTENMRGELIIIGVESEIPLDFGMEDLR
jgi:ABC-type taurine transport system substrate-binding protein